MIEILYIHQHAPDLVTYRDEKGKTHLGRIAEVAPGRKTVLRFEQACRLTPHEQALKAAKPL